MADIVMVKMGLRCCTSCLKSHCEECPYDGAESTFDCTADLANGALTVIEELQAEIERLTGIIHHEPDCANAEHDSGGCLGYSGSHDDEPIEACKNCEKYTSYTEEDGDGE